jgi:succinylglutamate desuccinylase
MLNVVEGFPEELLEVGAREVANVLQGPTLFHIPGKRPEPLFVSVLLHGNEDGGWEAVRSLLAGHGRKVLPRALSLFVGNVAAARENRRFLDGQADYNRIWTGGGAAERVMAGEIVSAMAAKRVFASIDIHNNTGMNPHYSCLYRLDNRSLNLAVLFSRTVVFARKPEGAQTQTFSRICPSVTIECGQQGKSRGADHARQFVEASLRMAELSDCPVPEHDVDLYHIVAVVKVREEVDFRFGAGAGGLSLRADLDRINFCRLEKDTSFGTVTGPPGRYLSVRDEGGGDATEHYFRTRGGSLLTRVPVMPSMFTTSAEAVRQDCLGYFMERISYGHLAKVIDGRAGRGFDILQR